MDGRALPAFGLPSLAMARADMYIHGICKECLVARSLSATGVREAKLFRNNRSQAIRIPAEFEFTGSRVLIHKEGDKLIIEPEPKADLLTILRGLQPLAPQDQFPEQIDATLLPLRSVDL